MTTTKHKTEPQPIRRFKDKTTGGTHMKKLAPLCCALLLALAGNIIQSDIYNAA